MEDELLKNKKSFETTKKRLESEKLKQYLDNVELQKS